MDRICQLSYHFDKGFCICISFQILDKALIHLDHIKGDFPDMVQGGIPRSKVIQSNPYSQAADLCQNMLHSFHIVNGKAFCYFKSQVFRFDAGFLDCVFHDLNNIRLEKLYHG